MVKKIPMLGCAVLLLMVAGCMTTSPGTLTQQPKLPGVTPSLPVPSETAEANPALPMNATVVIGTGENPFEVSIDSFEMDAPTEPGKRTVTVYVAVKNTGTEARQLVWFSRLTDRSGNTYGGIGISHGGTGARSGLIYPNSTEAARDYVVLPLAGFEQMSSGGILDVWFMIKKSDDAPVRLVPDYHARWVVNPGVIK